MAGDPHPLRLFLQGIVTGRSSTIPNELRGLARAVLGRRVCPAELDDLLGEFLLRLVEATRRNRAGSAVGLLALSDSAIRASIRHRLRQVLTESCPGARLRKQLRAAVKAVLSQPLPPAPPSLPVSLYRADRLSTAHVAAAVAWILSSSLPPPPNVQDIAGRLQALYFDGHRQPECEPVQRSFEDDVVRGLDGPQLALDLHRDLGHDLARVAALRAAGAELKTIAEDQRVAISTAHQRVATAVKRIRKQLRRRRIGPGTLEPMLAALGQ